MIKVSKILLAIYVLITSAALIALKWGTKTGSPVRYIENKLHFSLNYFIISGILLYGLSFIIYIYLISKYDLGYIIPVTAALVYTLIFTASYFIFHEAFTALKITGIVLIISGLVLLNLNK